jgi:hypothetical protein
MRNISSDALAKLTNNFGNEPVTIVEIKWTQGGQSHFYADKDIPPNIPGTILEVGGLDNVVQVTNGSDSSSIDMTLDDTDGTLKAIVDNNDIHMRPCWVYQWFTGLDLEDKFLVFKGKINSPITWSEGARTVQFSVVSQIEDVEIGFSIEEGDFFTPPQALIGEAWPLGFGTPVNVPALRELQPATGYLATGNGIADFTLPQRIAAARALICHLEFQGFNCKLVELGRFKCFLLYGPEMQCVIDRCTTTQDLEHLYDQQRQYEFKTMRIFGGTAFPQGVEITLNIDGGLFTGSFAGDIFTITKRRHPKKGTLVNPTSYQQVQADKINVFKANCGGKPEGLPADKMALLGPETIGVTQEAESQAYYSALQEAGFFWASPGTEVTIANGEDVVYAVNLLPSTVLRVAAEKQFDNGFTQLMTVPTDLYDVQITDYGGYQVTELVFEKPLSQVTHKDKVNGIVNDGWSDDLYVTYTSSVGPNVVDVIQWLIETYTEYEIDADSFSTVHDLVDVYRVDFAILERPNLITALNEIATQARCALYLRNDVFYIKYLPTQDASVDTITSDDIIAETLELFHTETEDLVTKYVASWKGDYYTNREKDNKIIQRYNVIKYGTHEDDVDYYIYNLEPLVEKSATFWLIRKSNTWRLVRFQTALHKLNIEVGDTVDLVIPSLAPITVPSICTKASYNSDSNTIEFEFWTPIRSGTQTIYDFAWPADVAENTIFPTKIDIDLSLAGSGKGPSFDTFAPPNTALDEETKTQQGFDMPCGIKDNDSMAGGNDNCNRKDHGQKRPSDQGDQKPDAKGKADSTGDGGAGASTPPPTGSADPTCCAKLADQVSKLQTQLADAQAKANEAINNQQGGGGGDDAGDQSKKLQDPDKLATKHCTLEVVTKKVTIKAVVVAEGQAEQTKEGTTGIPVDFVPSSYESITFNSKAAADHFIATQNTVAKSNQATNTVGNTDQVWECGYNVLPSQVVDWGDGCQEPNDPRAVAYRGYDGDGKQTTDNPSNSAINSGDDNATSSVVA